MDNSGYPQLRLFPPFQDCYRHVSVSAKAHSYLKGETLTNELGVYGEQQAAEYFLARGGIILGRNVRYSCGEIDLIVQIGGEVVFVEVKTRSSWDYGAAESVTPRKFARMKRAAAAWLEGQPRRSVRFDVWVYVVDKGETLHYEGIDSGAR